jgi:ribose transport system substrate-binding protein
MENILTANPDPGSIAGVWAAWDEPAYGALQAIQAAKRDKEGIVIVGIDATDFARDSILKNTSFKATVAQDFDGMAKQTVTNIDAVFGGKQLDQKEFYIPATLITAQNAK